MREGVPEHPSPANRGWLTLVLGVMAAALVASALVMLRRPAQPFAEVEGCWAHYRAATTWAETLGVDTARIPVTPVLADGPPRAQRPFTCGMWREELRARSVR